MSAAGGGAPPFTVAVLAGGRGRRLGGAQPKALATIGDRTLLQRAIECARAASGDVLVVAPSRLGLSHPGARAVEDALPDAGPLSALVAALEAASQEIVVVLGVDLPLVTPELLRRLAASLDSVPPSVDAVMPRLGRPQPLAAAYRRGSRAALRRTLASGERSLVAAVETLAVVWVHGADVDHLPGGRDALLNVNTPQDLERARTLVAAGGARP